MLHTGLSGWKLEALKQELSMAGVVVEEDGFVKSLVEEHNEPTHEAES